MYDSAFGFKLAPFSAVVDGRFCVTVPSFRAAFGEITNCLCGGKGIAVLTAPAGNGKSLFCQMLSQELADDYCVVMLPSGGFETRSALLQAILFELSLPFQGLHEQELRLQITSAARELGGKQSALVLLVDEAHTVAEPVLDELRSLTNLIEEGLPLVRILLSGQFPLEETLASPRLDALNQRIACHVTLDPLTRKESTNYVEYRLQRAGVDLQEVFTPEAVQTIVYAADGNPRCLNQLCDRTLSVASQYGVRPVPDSIVRRALADLKQLPLHWNDPPPSNQHNENDELDDTIVIPTEEAAPPQESLESNSDEVAGQTAQPTPRSPAAVIEFGGEDSPTEPLTPTLPESPTVLTGHSGENSVPDAAASIEFGADIFATNSPIPASPDHVTATENHDDTPNESIVSPWVTVESRISRPEATPGTENVANVSFGKTVTAGMLRSLAKQTPTAAAEPARDGETEEIAVHDHYASLLNEHRKPRDVQPLSTPEEHHKQYEPTAATISYSQNDAENDDPLAGDDCPSRLILDEDRPAKPDALIDSVMAVVQRIADEEPVADPSAIPPARTGEREIDNQSFNAQPTLREEVASMNGSPVREVRRGDDLPPLQELLNEVEYDIVRPLEIEEPETPVSNEGRDHTSSSADLPRPYIDLFTRLRRLQDAE